MPTRRQFLVNCSTAVAGVSVLPAKALAFATRNKISLEEISFSAFSRHLMSEFVAHDESRIGVALRLIEARQYVPKSALAIRTTEPGTERFSLIFCGPNHQALEQDTYRFEHSGLGKFDMFIVPVGRSDARWTYYEATFNRLKPSTSESGRKIIFR